MSSEEERRTIREKLIPEILADFETWGAEYQQERDLGARGEFANLYRKARKLKTLIWDGTDGSGWRESTRTIVKEVVAHGLLLLLDLDRAAADKAAEFKEELARPVELVEGPQRLGVNAATWDRLKVLADKVQNKADPSVLESEGFMIVTSTDREPNSLCVSQVCTLTKGQEVHSYTDHCTYRIRPRRYLP